MLTTILFVIGFAILIKGSDILIDGAVSIARLLGVSAWIIGLTIIGIGTSLPELAISLFAHIAGQSDIALSTIVGSNTFNLFFIIGAAALIHPLVLEKKWVSIDLLINIGAVLIVLLLSINGVTRGEGLLLLVLFLAWIYFVTRTESKKDDSQQSARVFTVPAAVVMIIAGLIGVYVGGKWVVDGAIALATYIGATETLVGLTAVAIGTSLPELVISVTAAFKNNSAIAVGNIIGSNIFDFLGIIGVIALVKPLTVSLFGILDTAVTLLAAVLLLGFALGGKRFIISRQQGFFMILVYAVYIAFIIYRGL